MSSFEPNVSGTLPSGTLSTYIYKKLWAATCVFTNKKFNLTKDNLELEMPQWSTFNLYKLIYLGDALVKKVPNLPKTMGYIFD